MTKPKITDLLRGSNSSFNPTQRTEWEIALNVIDPRRFTENRAVEWFRLDDVFDPETKSRKKVFVTTSINHNDRPIDGSFGEYVYSLEEQKTIAKIEALKQEEEKKWEAEYEANRRAREIRWMTPPEKIVVVIVPDWGRTMFDSELQAETAIKRGIKNLKEDQKVTVVHYYPEATVEYGPGSKVVSETLGETSDS